MRGAGDTMSASSVGGDGCSGAIGTQNARRASSSVTGRMMFVPRRPDYGASKSPALPSYLRRANMTGSGSISSNNFLGTLNRSAQVGGGSSGGSGRGSGVIPKKPRQPEESNAERHRGDSDRGEGARIERSGDVSRLGGIAPVLAPIVQEPGSVRNTSGPARHGVTDPAPRASSSVPSIPAPCTSSAASRGSPLSQRASRPEPVSLSAASGHREQLGDRPPRVTGVVNNAGGSSSAEIYRGSPRDMSSVVDRHASS